MPKTIYLTIDDAPSPDFMEKLALVEAHNIPAVWFAQGNHMEQRPEMIIEAIRRGQIVGNHSYSHPYFSKLSVDQCFAEIRACDAMLDEYYARAGVPRRYRYFRFPYGDKGDLREKRHDAELSDEGAKRHAEIQAYLRKLGYTLPRFADITHSWYEPFRYDADWWCSYLGYDYAPYRDWDILGLDTIEKVVARFDLHDPEQYCGLPDESSADLIVIHDFGGEAHEIFEPMIKRLVEMDVDFPSID